MHALSSRFNNTRYSQVEQRLFDRTLNRSGYRRALFRYINAGFYEMVEGNA